MVFLGLGGERERSGETTEGDDEGQRRILAAGVDEHWRAARESEDQLPGAATVFDPGA
jgi:hypothetical protein